MVLSCLSFLSLRQTEHNLLLLVYMLSNLILVLFCVSLTYVDFLFQTTLPVSLWPLGHFGITYGIEARLHLMLMDADSRQLRTVGRQLWTAKQRNERKGVKGAQSPRLSFLKPTEPRAFHCKTVFISKKEALFCVF